MEFDVSDDFDKSLAKYFYLLNFKRQSLGFLRYKYKFIPALRRRPA
jgi:hypothetical protein